MAVYDCFLFCHELELLELRLQILGDHVDGFALVESSATFMGIGKPLFYAQTKRLFSDWKSKIFHIAVEPLAPCYDAVKQEAHQRDGIKRAFLIPHLHDDDLILLNDADEIPNPAVFSEIPDGEPVRLSPYWSSFYLNAEVCGTQDPMPTVNGKPEWPHMRACRGAWFKEHTPSEIRWTEPARTIANAGWHFQNMGGPHSIAYKCRSFSHAQAKFDNWPWKDPAFIAKAMRDPFGPNSELSERLCPADKMRLPKYVVDNWEALKAKGMIYE